MKRIIALILCLIMAVCAVACNSGSTPAETTKAPSETQAPATDAPADTTEAPVETTEAPVETTEAPAPETTEAPATTPIEFADLSAAEQAAIKAVMPVSLPDFSQYEIVTRLMSFDRGAEDYVIQGNSQGSVKFVGELEGAIYGQATKVNAIDDGGTKRTEFTVVPLEDVVINDAKGVMFYVDFSNVQADAEKPLCASVTINDNAYRAKGPNGGNGDRSAIGYYYVAGTWVETANVNACRMELPAGFAGWVYIPATSFYDGTNKVGLGETFGDIFVMNMRCYTDGYVYSADNYIIFDEITFIK